MNGYLVASQMIQYKYICAHIKKCINPPIPFSHLHPTCFRQATLDCVKEPTVHQQLGSQGQLLSLEKATFHLSFLLSLHPDALQNKQTTYLHIIAKTAYQTTCTESLTVWSCKIQQTLAGLSMSLLLDLCFQMETI